MAIVFITLKVAAIRVEYEPGALIDFIAALTIDLQHAQFRALLGEVTCFVIDRLLTSETRLNKHSPHARRLISASWHIC